MPHRKFREWRRALARIEEDQIGYLDRQVGIFRLFQSTIHDATLPKGSVLNVVTNWMVLNYVALAATWVRKATDPRQDSISLGRLLNDMKAHAHLLTRARFRRMFRRHGVPDRHIDKQWEKHFGGGGHVTDKLIDRDLRRLARQTASTRKLVNKLVAHTERDRRKWPKVVLGRIRESAELLIATYHKYNLLVRGRAYHDDLSKEEKGTIAELFATFWRAAAEDPRFVVRRPPA